MCCRCGDLVLLFVSFAARCDEFLWGRLLTCGGLAIRLPRWDAPLRPSENRLHRWRHAAVWGRLLTCAAVGYRRRSDANAAVGRLTIGRSLPSCPTRSQPPTAALCRGLRWCAGWRYPGWPELRRNRHARGVRDC